MDPYWAVHWVVVYWQQSTRGKAWITFTVYEQEERISWAITALSVIGSHRIDSNSHGHASRTVLEAVV